MSQTKTVLIIDDDVVFAEFLRTAVESVGHRAVIAPDGHEALRGKASGEMTKPIALGEGLAARLSQQGARDLLRPVSP